MNDGESRSTAQAGNKLSPEFGVIPTFLHSSPLTLMSMPHSPHSSKQNCGYVVDKKTQPHETGKMLYTDYIRTF